MKPWVIALAFVLLVSAGGLTLLLRGLRILGRKRHGQCIACGHQMRVPTSESHGAPQVSTICTECGRPPELDLHAPRRATAYVALGIAAQFVWVLLGATEWPTASVLLVETSVMLLVFACEPLIERAIRWFADRRRAATSLPDGRRTPRRPLLRIAAFVLVAGGWSWIGHRVAVGSDYLHRAGRRTMNHPLCRPMLTNRSEWMTLVLPPPLVEPARIRGLIVNVTKATDQPVEVYQRDHIDCAWVYVPLTRAAKVIDIHRLVELHVAFLDDEMFRAEDADRLPELPKLELLNLDAASLSLASIEHLLTRTPNLRTLRVNYLDSPDADALRARYPTIEIDAAEEFGGIEARSRGAEPQGSPSTSAGS